MKCLRNAGSLSKAITQGIVPAHLTAIQVLCAHTPASDIIRILNRAPGEVRLTDKLPGCIPLKFIGFTARAGHLHQPRQRVILKAQHLPVRAGQPQPAPEGRLAEAGFTTGVGVTVKITEGVLMIIADTSEVQVLKAELYQFKQTAMGMKALVI